MIQITEQHDEFVRLDARGKIRKEDYDALVPALEEQIDKAGKLRCLIHLDEVEGIEPGAVLEDLRFDLKHRKDFERCAVVGDSKVEALATKLAQPIYAGQIKYFQKDDAAAARTWVEA